MGVGCPGQAEHLHRGNSANDRYEHFVYFVSPGTDVGTGVGHLWAPVGTSEWASSKTSFRRILLRGRKL